MLNFLIGKVDGFITGVLLALGAVGTGLLIVLCHDVNKDLIEMKWKAKKD